MLLSIALIQLIHIPTSRIRAILNNIKNTSYRRTKTKTNMSSKFLVFVHKNLFLDFKTNPAYYPDTIPLLHAADIPALSYNTAEIPGSAHFQVLCLRS